MVCYSICCVGSTVFFYIQISLVLPVASKLVNIMLCLKYEVREPASGQWTACGFHINRLVANASLCDIVKLPAGSHQLFLATAFGLKLFMHQQTLATTLFRPLPIFRIKLLRTIADSPANQFEIYWQATEEHTKSQHNLHLLMPERCTVKKLIVDIRRATVGADVLYNDSTNTNKFMFVFDDALAKNTRRMALPLLLQGVGLRRESSASKSSKKDVKRVSKLTSQR